MQFPKADRALAIPFQSKRCTGQPADGEAGAYALKACPRLKTRRGNIRTHRIEKKRSTLKGSSVRHRKVIFMGAYEAEAPMSAVVRVLSSSMEVVSDVSESLTFWPLESLASYASMVV